MGAKLTRGRLRWVWNLASLNYISQNSFPFHVCFQLRWASKKTFCTRFGGWKWSSSHCFYVWMISASYQGTHAQCCFSVGSSNWYKAAAGPAAAPPSLGSSLSVSDSWTRYVFSSMMKEANFSFRIPTSSKLQALRETGMHCGQFSWVLAPVPSSALQTSSSSIKQTTALQRHFNRVCVCVSLHNYTHKLR